MITKSLNTTRWLLIIILAIIWGSSFILMKKALVVYSPDQVASIRMLASFLFLLPFIYNHFREIPVSRWKWILLTGLAGNGIPAFLFATAQTQVASATAGILNSLTPVFTLILGITLFGSKFSSTKLGGVLLGFAGAAMLVMISGNTNQLNISWYAMLIVLATIGYATSVNIMRYRLQNVRSVLISGFALCLVGPITGIYLFMTDFTTVLRYETGATEALVYVLLLALFGTAISIVLFNYLVKISGAIFASSVTYLIPVVALIWGFADGENLSLLHFGAMVLILLGVYLINLKKKQLHNKEA